VSVTASFKTKPQDGAITYEIPVCTEALFSEVFRPIAVRLDLDLVREWGTMAEISSSNFSVFIEQIVKLKKAIIDDPDLKQALKDHVESRLDTLHDEMTIFFKGSPGGTVLVG